jgi:hypothetical protein
MLRVWYSTKSFADFIVDQTILSQERAKGNLLYNELAESDASKPKNFHQMPDHIKKILYLDAPDIIIEHNSEPILSIEISKEAGTGHNVFQRFGRLVASVENSVPAVYIYPEAVVIGRKNSTGMNYRWDPINPNIFKALESVMRIHQMPALFYYFPSQYNNHLNSNSSILGGLPQKGLIFERNIVRYPDCPLSTDTEMIELFKLINLVVNRALNSITRPPLLNERLVINRISWMQSEFAKKGGHSARLSPETATIIIPTQVVFDYLMKRGAGVNYQFGELLSKRQETVIYQVDANWRADPYPGTLAAVDYLFCRNGKTIEDRDRNLVLAWGNAELDENNCLKIVHHSRRIKTSVKDFFGSINTVRSSRNKCLLNRGFKQLKSREIPRYYMQTRYGCTFTKSKDIRMYAYFADAILFTDGAVWRDG